MRAITAVLTVMLLAGAAVRRRWAQPATGPRAADSASPEAIIAALYDVISGPAGQARDWDRFRGLFAIGARLLPAAPRPDGSAPVALSPDDYVTRSNDRLVKDGFFEQEIASRTEAFGTIMHVFSTYESRRAKADEKPFARGHQLDPADAARRPMVDRHRDVGLGAAGQPDSGEVPRGEATVITCTCSRHLTARPAGPAESVRGRPGVTACSAADRP